MCLTVHFPDGGEVESIGQLLERAPAAAPATPAGWSFDLCLCGTDVPAALRLAGLRFEALDDGDYVVLGASDDGSARQ